MNYLLSFARVLTCLLAVCAVSSAQAQVVFEDQFNAPTLDTNAWTFVGDSSSGGNGNLTGITGRTQFNIKPYNATENGVQFIRLALNTYNSAYPGTNFKGTEMYSRRGFGPNVDGGTTIRDGVLSPIIPSETGFEFETRMRYTNPQPSGVGAFWTYWNHGSSGNIKDSSYSGYELDYEIFANDALQSHNVYHLNNYRDFNTSPSRGGDGAYTNYNAPYVRGIVAQGVDYTQWHYAKIVWTPKTGGGWRTNWSTKSDVNGTYQDMGEISDVTPDKWMTVRFNIWNFGGNPAVSPTNNSSQNQTYFLDVDWVKVSKVASISANVTEVGGVAVSPSATTTVPNLSVIKGQVTGSATMINVVIRRLSDNTKWKGYADGNGPAGWVPDSQNVGISTDNAQPNWTTNGTLPSGSNLTASDYQISADVLAGGTYVSSPIVTVRILSNATPVSQSFGPASGSTNVGTARASNAIYTDADGFNDIAECAIEFQQGNVATQAFYNRAQNKLYLSDGNGGRTAGSTPGTGAPLDNGFGTLNCAATDIFTSVANKQVQVRWNFTPKQPLAGNNVVNLDVTDQAGARAGFVQKATWTIIGAPTGNSAPVAVAFSPASGSSSVGNAYATNAIYSDVDGTSDLKFLIVAIAQGNRQTRARYDVATNLLYLQNDGGQYVGGVAPGANSALSNSLVTLDCSQTTLFVTTDSRKQIQVRWRFVAQSGLVGANDIYLLAFDQATASSGFQKRATWNLTSPNAARSSSDASMTTNSGDFDSKQTYTDANPFVGEISGTSNTKGFPRKNTPDGSQEPPFMAIPRDASGSAPSALTQKSPSNPSADTS